MKGKTDWSCDSCHTSNYAQESSCRVCGREAGSATGVQVPPEHRPLTVTDDKTVAFVESRHKDLPRPTITLAPMPPSRPALPKPPVPPTFSPPPPRFPRTAPRTPRPASGRALRGVARYLLVVIVAIILIAILDRIGSLLGSARTSATGPTATSCPADTARWLPGNGDGAKLVARYDTGKHIVTICLDSTGSYHYDGQLKGNPVTAENHISLSAERTIIGFTAVNGEYRYEISGQDLTVSYKGEILSQMHLTPTPS